MQPGPADSLSFPFVFIDILALFPEFHAVDDGRFADRPYHCVGRAVGSGFPGLSARQPRGATSEFGFNPPVSHSKLG
jgi:hypothetical protein